MKYYDMLIVMTEVMIIILYNTFHNLGFEDVQFPESHNKIDKE